MRSRRRGTRRTRGRRLGFGGRAVSGPTLYADPEWPKIHDILDSRAGASRSSSSRRGPTRRRRRSSRRCVELEPLRPSYVSVTYGAGGTTRELTHDIVVRINRETTLTAMAHLTCAAHTRAELTAIIERYRDSGIENILALGGDPPAELDLPPGRAEVRGRSRPPRPLDSATSRSASPRTPNPIHVRRRSSSTGRTRPRSSPRPTSRSRSSSSTPTTTSSSSSRCTGSASTSR